MFLRICSRNYLRQSISFMQMPFYNANNQFSRTGRLATVKRDFYSDLKVPRNAIQREIREAYTAYSKLYQAQIAAGVKDATEKLKRLHQAYYVLGNVDRKRFYDKGLTSFSKELPESVPETLPAIFDAKRNTSIAKPESFKMGEKIFKEYLDKQLGDLHDKVIYKEKKEAIEGATEVFLEGDIKLEDLPVEKSKPPDTYTERALRKLMQKGRFPPRE